jgi:peptidoglycan/LPS O-acetylase OafA/YrhL
MFGSFRLILSILVVLSHFGFTAKGLNPGQWSVISFYALSGFLMEKQVGKLCQNGALLPFYADRFLRILPLYLVSLLLSLPFFSLSFGAYLQNFLLLPVNYVAFTEVTIMNRPAWSLACEAHFYLLVPFLSMLSTTTLRIISMLSLSLYCVSSQLPYPSFWSFHGLPALLFVFCSGMHLNRRDFSFLKLLWVSGILILLVFTSSKILDFYLFSGIQINVMIGFILSLPIIARLSKLSPHYVWDKRLGSLSYPIFICHIPMSYYCYTYFEIGNPFFMLFISIITSILLAVLIEAPLDKVRHKIRNRLSRNTIAALS